MTLRYPGGKKYVSPSKQANQSTNMFANRGMSLEEDLNATNQFYIETGRAVIHKKPTPVQVVHVDYPRRSAAKITEAYFKQPSTTDYNGIYRGKYIDFEAKETKNKTSFPFGNIHSHQVEHMQSVLQHGGIAFLIIRFSLSNETYLYDAAAFITWYFEQSKRKSIPKSIIENDGHVIRSGLTPRLDYLSAVDQLL
ncbi:Holliday junction resolvase RecU [Bacillus piscicola]|uniref:Holliday junction resolvase RecU n=1 Tax=Bacillus piscicola TaxID=1632684 RepID=UPI001F092549|nr:Holliday junction resolvase RecU [Bacillus piscicola]